MTGNRGFKSAIDIILDLYGGSYWEKDSLVELGCVKLIKFTNFGRDNQVTALNQTRYSDDS